MSDSDRIRRTVRQQSRLADVWSGMRKHRLAVLVTCLAIVAGIIAVPFIAGAQQAGAGKKAPNGMALPITGKKGVATCDEPGQSACPTPDPGWVPLASESPADVIKAVKASIMYSNEVSAHGDKIVGLNVPVMVKPLKGNTGVAFYDSPHFIVRAHDTGQHDSATFDYLYDRVNHRIRFAGFGLASPGNPAYSAPFPAFVTQQQAIQALSAQHGVGIKAGFQPELVFFPPDPAIMDRSSTIQWTGGGYDPTLPLWHLLGSDNTDYFVGIDQKVHLGKDIPVAHS